MGIFDKVKGALNIGGVKVQITKFENPFPIEDTAYKGHFEFSTQADHVVLSSEVKLIGEYEVKTKDGNTSTEEIVFTEEVDDGSDEVYGRSFQYPVEMKKGESIQDSFCLLLDKTIKDKLVELGCAKFEDITFKIVVSVDVKGTPFDPDAEEVVEVLL